MVMIVAGFFRRFRPLSALFCSDRRPAA